MHPESPSREREGDSGCIRFGPDGFAWRRLSPKSDRMNERSFTASEFDAPEEEAAYVAWLRAKVAASLADPRPPVPHDEAMAEIRAIIEMKRSGKTC